MKKQLGFAALAMVASTAAFAQQAVPITFSAEVKDVSCLINIADSALKVEFGTVDANNLAAASKTVNLEFKGCKPSQTIQLAATTTNGAAGSAAGRLALATGAGKAAGIEIAFEVGSNAALPLDNTPHQVAVNPTLQSGVPSVGNVTVPLKATVVATGATVVNGTIDASLTLVAHY